MAAKAAAAKIKAAEDKAKKKDKELQEQLKEAEKRNAELQKQLAEYAKAAVPAEGGHSQHADGMPPPPKKQTKKAKEKKDTGRKKKKKKEKGGNGEGDTLPTDDKTSKREKKRKKKAGDQEYLESLSELFSPDAENKGEEGVPSASSRGAPPPEAVAAAAAAEPVQAGLLFVFSPPSCMVARKGAAKKLPGAICDPIFRLPMQIPSSDYRFKFIAEAWRLVASISPHSQQSTHH